MNIYKHGEFQILEGPASHVQKVLNQWRHEYILSIINMVKIVDTITVLLFRVKDNA